MAWYAIERFFTHIMGSVGLVVSFTFLLAWVVRKKKIVADPRVVLGAACALNLIFGLLNEAWDYPADGAWKTGSDVVSWILGSAGTPWALYRLHKWWSQF